MATVSLVENTNSIGPLQFDAIMEDTEQITVRPTRYPIDANALPSDHAVIMPDVVTMMIAVGDNALNNSYDLLSAAKGIGLSAFSEGGFDSSFVSVEIAKNLAIYSAGSPSSRSGFAMSLLRALAKARPTFTVVSSKGTYTDMMLVDVRKTTTNEDQAALFAEIRLEEVPKTSARVIGEDALGSQVASIFAPIADFGRRVGTTVSDTVSGLFE